jgi:hypothetical protein
MSTPRSVIELAKKSGAKMVDIKFVHLGLWISAKRKEHDALRLRPHPYEFFLYYDV